MTLASGLTENAIKVFKMAKEQQAEQADVNEYTSEFLEFWRAEKHKWANYASVAKRVAWVAWEAGGRFQSIVEEHQKRVAQAEEENKRFNDGFGV